MIYQIMVMEDKMLSFAKSAVKKTLFYCGYYKLLEHFKRPRENRLLILMYHNLVKAIDQNSDWYNRENPNPAQFDAVLFTLKKYFRVVTIEDAVQEIMSNGRLLEKSVAITIDDGYQSAYNIAFPLLKKHGLEATVYLATDWIGKQIYPWWVSLADIIRNCSFYPDLINNIEDILGVSIGVDSARIRDTRNAQSLLYSRVENIIRHKEDDNRELILNKLRTALLGDREFIPNSEKILSWEQIREMSAYGIRFGAHTCSHINLSFSDLQLAEHEISESKLEIERQTKVEVAGFAYPYGDDIGAYVKFIPILKKCNYKYACVSMTGNVNAQSDLYLLHRIHMPSSTSKPILARTLNLEYLSAQ